MKLTDDRLTASGAKRARAHNLAQGNHNVP